MRSLSGYKLVVTVMIICVLPFTVNATDTIPVPEKSSRRWLAGSDTVHNPRRATILSAILPGTGQAYNKKYWKMPIVYAAGIAGGYMIHSNSVEWRKYRQAYIQRLAENPDPGFDDPYPFLSDQQLRVYRDVYRRDMELSIILTTAVYLLQILDATVDAHLFDFDVSNNLVIHWRPVFIPTAIGTARGVGGLSLELGFRKSTPTKPLQHQFY